MLYPYEFKIADDYILCVFVQEKLLFLILGKIVCTICKVYFGLCRLNQQQLEF